MKTNLILLICLSPLILLILGQFFQIVEAKSERYFTVDYTKNNFIKDGQIFRYISGSIHYFRIPEIYWYDRLYKVKAAGLNAIEFYIPWNFHNFKENEYQFSNNRNLTKFLSIANDLDLLVLLRIGPYICGEWDFGGFPAWLLQKNPKMVLRSSEPDYLFEVKKWYAVLLPLIKPYLYSNNGPIAMVQIENEYGSYYTCDSAYLRWLHDTVRLYLGNKIQLFTTDGFTSSYLKCGATDRRVFSTVDFSATTALNPSGAFADLRKIQPRGPLVNSEFYSGWLDSWGSKHNIVPTDQVVKGLQSLLNYTDNNALVSLNMYMFHGGTTFGFWNGANSPPYNPQTTSYDYNAPLSEAGDVTSKYLAIRSLLHKMNPKKKLLPIPSNTTKMAFGPLLLIRHHNYLQSILQEPGTKSMFPQSMESLSQYHGYMVYQTNISHFVPGSIQTLTFQRIGDFAYIFTANPNFSKITFQGQLSRKMSKLDINITIDSNLVIVVENAGHVNYGSQMLNEVKGIIGNVTVKKIVLTDWIHHKINLTNATFRMMNYQKLNTNPNQTRQCSLFIGQLVIRQPFDTFLKLNQFNKGVVYINGYNLGRYWNSAGPQLTLFVPKSILKRGINYIVVFELEGSSNQCSDYCKIEFLAQPDLTGGLGVSNIDIKKL